jgi:uncharacterized MnhB-related membrane protein
MVSLAFDALVAAALLWSAVRAITAQDLFRGVILFIVFGLLMALAWARLGAPDIALAEAAIGAGLGGALLLDTVGHLRAMSARPGTGVGPDADPAAAQAPEDVPGPAGGRRGP